MAKLYWWKDGERWRWKGGETQLLPLQPSALPQTQPPSTAIPKQDEPVAAETSQQDGFAFHPTNQHQRGPMAVPRVWHWPLESQAGQVQGLQGPQAPGGPRQHFGQTQQITKDPPQDQKTGQGSKNPASKFQPLGSDGAFLATVEQMGVTTTMGGVAMSVDAGATTGHAEAIADLARAEEAYQDVASKYGAESAMATTLQAHVEQLRKQHTPLRVSKSVVSLQGQILRLQKDLEKHRSDLAKLQQDTEAKVQEHRDAIASLQGTLAQETAACNAALATDQGVLDKLQAEVQALTAQATVPPRLPPHPKQHPS